MDNTGKDANFEGIVRKLGSIITNMESEDIELEAALKAFEEGTVLLRTAQSYLKDAEQRVNVLVDNSNPGSLDGQE